MIPLLPPKAPKHTDRPCCAVCGNHCEIEAGLVLRMAGYDVPGEGYAHDVCAERAFLAMRERTKRRP